MPKESYPIVAGLVIGMIVLLIAAIFIFILVSYSNNRKKKFIQEKFNLQTQFQEQMLQAKLEMQEQTFNRISAEIHDNVGQLLSLAKVQLNIMEAGEKLDKPLLTEIKESVGKAMIDLRDIARSMNADRLRFTSLVEATDHELKRIGRLDIIKTFMTVEGMEMSIEEQKKLIILRIVQESLQNILKHAQAKQIDVKFLFGDNQFNVEITDDGLGFNYDPANKKNGLGLQNIISRAKLIGGNASISSAVNMGTKISITLPYE